MTVARFASLLYPNDCISVTALSVYIHGTVCICVKMWINVGVKYKL